MSSLTLRKLYFSICESTYCCGMYEVGGFSQESPCKYTGGRFVKTPNAYKTKEDLFNDFEEMLLHKVCDELVDRVKGTYGLIATLIEGQYPDLQEHMLTSGWTKVNTWKNQNTQNRINLYQKTLSKEDMKKVEKMQ